MSTFEAIALIAVGSVAVMRAVQQLAPNVAASARARIAKRFLRREQSATAHRIGTLLTPTASRPSSGCGSGCSSCAGCPVAEVKSDFRGGARDSVPPDARVQP